MTELDLIVFDSDNDSNSDQQLFAADDNMNTVSYYRSLSAIQLEEHLTTCLQSISNNHKRKYNMIRLYNLLLSAETRLDNDQLTNVLKTIGTDSVSYDGYEITTSMELELHLRTYSLALEVYGKRPLIMGN